MEASKVNIPLNTTQLEILKLLSRELEEKDLVEIKRLIVRYLSEKANRLADEAWEEKGWSNEEIDNLLNTHDRTSYHLEN